MESCLKTFGTPKGSFHQFANRYCFHPLLMDLPNANCPSNLLQKHRNIPCLSFWESVAFNMHLKLSKPQTEIASKKAVFSEKYVLSCLRVTRKKRTFYSVISFKQ